MGCVRNKELFDRMKAQNINPKLIVEICAKLKNSFTVSATEKQVFLQKYPCNQIFPNKNIEN